MENKKSSKKIYILLISVILAVILIGGACFLVFANLKYKDKAEGTQGLIIENGVVIGWSGTETKVTIPYQYDGKTVTEIAQSAFVGASIEKIEIPSTVHTIGAGAFANCTSLSKIEGGLGVTWIDEKAFENTPWLSSCASEAIVGSCLYSYCGIGDKNGVYVMNSEITAISPSAIFGNNSIKEIVLSPKVNKIGNSAFRDCVNLEKLQTGVKIEQVGKNILEGTLWKDNQPAGLVLLAGVCLGYKGLIPNGYLTLPDRLVSIADGAFYGNTSLIAIEMPNSVLYLGDSAFENCDALKIVILSDGIKTIGEFAFKDCDGIESVKLPLRLTKIGNSAFYNCSGIRVLDASKCDRLNQVGENAFYGCARIEEFCTPASIEKVGEYAFAEMTSLKKVEFGNASFSISGEGVFYNCKKLEEFTFNQNCALTRISESFFENCEKLQTVNINAIGIEEIAMNAFKKCTALTTFSVPDSVVSINDSAFYESGIENLIFSDKTKVKTIGQYAFYGSKIKNLVLPEGLTSVGMRSFASSALINVSIPASLESLGKGAFSNCENLLEYQVEGNNFSVINGDLYSADGKVLICFVAGKNRKDFVVGENVTEIAEYAFCGDSLETITFGVNLNKISDYAFYNASALKILCFTGENAPKLGRYLFFTDASVTVKCSNLQEYQQTFDKYSEQIIFEQSEG